MAGIYLSSLPVQTGNVLKFSNFLLEFQMFIMFVEFIIPNTKLKSVWKANDALQRYWAIKINFSGKFDSAFLVLKTAESSNWNNSYQK